MKKILVIIAGVCIISSCSNNANKEAEEQLQVQQKSMDSMKNEMVKKQIIDSMNAVNAANPVVVTKERTVVRHSTPAGNSTPNRTTTTTETNISTSNAANAPTPKKRRGLGPTATGAIIGAGVGGITGAMVHKKKGEGAVVGGILGAGAGAGVGAIINKKQKQKDQKELEEAE